MGLHLPRTPETALHTPRPVRTRPVQFLRDKVELLTARPGCGDSNRKPSSDVRVTKFRGSAQRMKGTGELQRKAESMANIFSPARMLLFGPNSAPNSRRIPPIEALAAPGVRIHPSPPNSLACFHTIWRSGEIGAWGAIHARRWNQRMPPAAAERENLTKFSVRDFGGSICEPADI